MMNVKDVYGDSSGLYIVVKMLIPASMKNIGIPYLKMNSSDFFLGITLITTAVDHLTHTTTVVALILSKYLLMRYANSS
jgi:hypothetical protein